MSQLRIVALVLVLAGCGAREGPEATPRAPEPETALEAEPTSVLPDVALNLCAGEVTDAGVIEDPRLTEISGLVASRREAGVLWAHNDSGEATARFFALGLDGTTRAEIEIRGAPHVDWEDVARFTTAEGRELLYFADTGDNGARDGSVPPRTHVDVVVVEPPPLPPGITPATLFVDAFEVLSFRYPSGPHDCEAIAIDARGHLYFITKMNEGPHTVFVDRAPHAPGETRTLERLGDVLPAESLGDAVTAIDLDADHVVIRTYVSALYFSRTPGASLVETLGTEALVVTHLREHQGEAIAVDGDGFFTVSEGDGETLHHVAVGPCPE